jgi:hypothetical protein
MESRLQAVGRSLESDALLVETSFLSRASPAEAGTPYLPRALRARVNAFACKWGTVC